MVKTGSHRIDWESCTHMRRVNGDLHRAGPKPAPGGKFFFLSEQYKKNAGGLVFGNLSGFCQTSQFVGLFFVKTGV